MFLKKNREVAILLLIIIPFFKPSGLEYYSFLNNLFIIWKYISIFIILLRLSLNIILYYKNNVVTFENLKNFLIYNCSLRIKVNKGLISLSAFWLIFLFNNARRGLYDIHIVSNALVSIVLIYFIVRQVKIGNYYNLLLSFKLFFPVWIYIHFASVILSRIGIHLFGTLDGDYLYFLGTDNYSAFILIPMIGILLYSDFYIERKEKKQKYSRFIYILLYTIINLFLKSYTAFFSGVLIILLLFLSQKNKKIVTWLTMNKMIVFCFLFLALILVFRIQDLFSIFLVDILGKGLTLNSRTIIWNSSLSLIKKHFFLGYGSLTASDINSYLLFGTDHAHNILLDLLLMSGIIGMLLYFYFMTYPLRRIDNKQYRNIILSIFYAGQMVLFLLDFYVTIPYFYCFVGLLYAEGILSQYDNIKQGGELHDEKNGG